MNQPIALNVTSDMEEPSIYINRFAARMMPSFVRLSFGEEMPDGSEKYRTSVAMTMDTAQQLSELLQGLLKQTGQWTEKEAGDGHPGNP